MKPYDPYDSLVPVFLRTDVPQRTRQFATAELVELHGEPYLLPAAHVTDEAKSGELLVPTRDGLEPIEGYMAYIDLPPEIRRADDTTDIAYYRLSTRFANSLAHQFRVLRHERSEHVASAHDYVVYTASGYPASKAKKDGTKHLSEVFSFRGAIAQPDTYSELGLSPDDSIVIHFHRKPAVHHETFEAFPTPGLKGVSGGALFAWPHGQEVSQDWSLPKFVGIVHSFKEREGLIIGTTFLPIVAAILLGRMKGFGGVQ